MFIKMGNDIVKITAFDEIFKCSNEINFYKLGADGRMVLATTVAFKTKEECEEQWERIAGALGE